MTSIQKPPATIAKTSAPTAGANGEAANGVGKGNAVKGGDAVADTPSAGSTRPTTGATFDSTTTTAGSSMSGHRDLKVATSDHVLALNIDANETLDGATETLAATHAALEGESGGADDRSLVGGAISATKRAAKKISAKAPLNARLFQTKDGVSPTSLLGVIKKQGDVATFVPHDPSLSAFALPKALADSAENGRVVRLTREGSLRLQSPTADPAAEVEVELASAAEGKVRGRFIGPVVVEDGKTFVEDPYHAGGSVRVPLTVPEGAEIAPGAVVDVTVDADGQASVIGKPLANAGSARAEMYGVFARHQIDPTFPADVMAEVAALQKNDGIQSGLDSGELKDFREMAFVTIDNADSRDLDQAMYIEKHPDGSFDVFYALADASHYVAPGSALFRESMKRAASYYLPGLAVPMLPAELSEDLVSLNAGKDRRAMVMKLSVGNDGKPAGTTIERGVIQSRAKLAYDRVNEFHNDVAAGTGDKNSEHFGHDFTETLMLLKEVGEIRMDDAASRDVVSFRRTPVKVVTNDAAHASADGADSSSGTAKNAGADAPVFSVIADERNAVEKWNEQVSLLANIEGAKFFLKHLDNPDLQATFRVHDAPPRSRIENLHRFVRKLVHSKKLDRKTWLWDRKHESLAKYLARLPTDGDNLRVTKAIHQQAMITNVKSLFSAEAGGHHGVGTDEGYARFSSPMRELVGIFVHKEAFEALLGAAPGNDPTADAALRERIIEISNAAKQIQGRVTKEANKLAIDQLFAPDLDKPAEARQTFKGTIMAVTRGKAYVQLDDPPIDVKVYLNGLEDVLGGQVSAGKDGVSLQGAFEAQVTDAITLKVDSYDEKFGRYNLVPVVAKNSPA